MRYIYLWLFTVIYKITEFEEAKMDRLDIIDKAQEAEKKLKVVLRVLGERGVDEETQDGCVWILGDVRDIIHTIAHEKVRP
jgi:hypothetical protein